MGQLNQTSIQLLLDFEVGGGEAYYNKFLRRPTWPGAASGVTIGIGYDLGYNSTMSFTNDWQEVISENDFNRLNKTLGIKGMAAKSECEKLKDIVIEWEDALNVFENVTIPKFYRIASKTFPGLEQLHPNAQGALTSLIFNRGSSLEGDSRREMRAIKVLVPKKDYKGIAQQLQIMKRIWAGKNLPGLLKRRDAEAKLVLSSLQN